MILILVAPGLLMAAGEPFITTQVRFKGIGGEQPVYDDGLLLTVGEVKKLREGKYKAAYVDNKTAGEYSLAIIGGPGIPCSTLELK